jgi:hypothetical protein
MAQAKEAGDTRTLAGAVLGLGGLAVAVLVVCWQGYMWLKTGHWPHLTLISALTPVISGTDFSAWLVAPQSWYGLHSATRFLFDLPLFLWIVAFAALALHTLLD